MESHFTKELIMSREKRIKFKPQGVSKTDQSFKISSDINALMARYAKTKILPNLNERQGVYGDFSQATTLEEAFESVHAAVEAFNSLPAEVRKAMDNDPSKLELWLSDENNQEMAVKYGLKEKPVAADLGESELPNENTQDNNTHNNGGNNA
jgi:phage internal scaffolding protein